MSVSVYVKTEKNISANSIMESLIAKGENVISTSEDFSLHIGTVKKSLRGVEVNKEDGGYEIRLFSFSNPADYRLFPIVIKTVMELTGENALSEDQEEVKDPFKDYGSEFEDYDRKWIFKQFSQELRKPGASLKLEGLLARFPLTAAMFQSFGINLEDPYNDEKVVNFLNYIATEQWKFAGK